MLRNNTRAGLVRRTTVGIGLRARCGVALSASYPPTAKRSETIKGPNRLLIRFRGTTPNSVAPIIHNDCHAARKVSVALPVNFAITYHAPNRAE